MQNHKQFLSRLGLTVPIIQAPMANVSNAKVASAVSRSGGIGSLALSPIDLAKDTQPVFDEIAKFRSQCHSSAIVNCNFFCFDPKEQTVPTKDEAANWFSLYEGATGVPRAEIGAKVDQFTRAVVSFREFEENDPEAFSAFLKRLIAERVGVVSFHFGVPSKETVSTLKKGGIMVWGCVTSVPEAKKLADFGVDVLVCQGYEAGGHRGNFLVNSVLDENLSTSALFSQVKRYTETLQDPPFLVPSGGIVDGATTRDYLEKGAAAVQLGTVFIPSAESSAPPFIGKSIDEKKQVSTIMTPLISGRSARTLCTPFIKGLTTTQVEKHYTLPSFGYSTSAYRKFASGQKKYGFYLAGQNYHSVETGKSAEEIMASLKEGIEGRKDVSVKSSPSL